jgi:hypothetical protein
MAERLDFMCGLVRQQRCLLHNRGDFEYRFAIHASSRAFMIRRRGQALRDETLLQLGWIVRSFVATMSQLGLDPVVR